MTTSIAATNSVTSRTLVKPGYRGRQLFLLALVLLAVIPAFNAFYLLGKAKLAQTLISRSWQNETGAKPWPCADTYPVARLSAPQVDLQTWVLAGASGHSLSFGPGLADGSVAAGANGVVMIAGHRDTSFCLLYTSPSPRDRG